jgi:glycosyltransferase involved in cell wall biosynthesis
VAQTHAPVGDETAPIQEQRGSRALRVVHCPVNVAGIPWQNVQALRRKGVDARLVVFNRGRLHRDADVDLQRPTGFLRAQAVQWRALARLLPRTDVFHFYFGLTLVPKSLQFPLLRAFRKKSLYHFLGSDIRGRTPADLAYGKRADAQVVGSYDAIRWVPDAEVIPPGLDLSAYAPVPPSDSARPLVVHAPSDRRRKGTEHVVRACEQLGIDLDVVERVPHDEARLRYERADIVVEQLNAGWHGVFGLEAMALGKPVVTYLKEDVVRRTEEAFGVRVPIVSATKQTLAERLRPLVDSPAERRRLGAESRAYVEHVHDIDRIADRLIELYSRL